MESDRPVRRVAIVGNHTPRRCGIATYTQDLAQALRKAGAVVDVVALSDEPGYDYPEGVLFEIPESDLTAYRYAATRLNAGKYDLVNLQHEYGIFGGPSGSYVLTLLRELKMPIVATLHTVLEHPNEQQVAVMDEIVAFAQRLIVMSKRAAEILRRVHRVPESKISVIHHGIIDLPDTPPEEIKSELGLGSGPVVLTFGLLSPGKGIEYAIEAMTLVPDAIYLVAGQTHPGVKRHNGECYRESLIKRAKDCDVESRVRFIFDRYLDEQELARLIRAADIYVTPYPHLEQASSGTLAYAVGNGKATVSTPYSHAQELLSDGRGVLVPPRDPKALGEAIQDLIEDDEWRHEIEAKARAYGEPMRWPAVAMDHLSCFSRAAGDNGRLLKGLTDFGGWSAPQEPVVLPEVRLDHLDAITDDTGILQHVSYTIPNRHEGYCLDDNARALSLTVALEALGLDDPRLHRLQATYLSFCAHAMNPDLGCFRNFMSFDRKWLEDRGSEDSQARALWCLAATSRRSELPGVRALAREVYAHCIPVADSFVNPRAWAYSCLGFAETADNDGMRRMACQLLSLYREHSSPDWPWFEPMATYANARLPQAMIVAGRGLGDPILLSVGLDTLSWLCEIQTEEGVFIPIGNDGFFPQDSRPARYDQQPIEAVAHVSACLSALAATGDPRWRCEADQAFGWFMGRNSIGVQMADTLSGGCRDGLMPSGPNENQGAESTLSFLAALAEMKAVLNLAPRGTLS